MKHQAAKKITKGEQKQGYPPKHLKQKATGQPSTKGPLRCFFQQCIGHLPHRTHIFQCTRRPPPDKPVTGSASTDRHSAAKFGAQAPLMQNPNALTCLDSAAYRQTCAAAASKRDTSDVPKSMSTSGALLTESLQDERLSLFSNIMLHSLIVSAVSSAGSLFCCPPFQPSAWKRTQSARSHRSPRSSHETSNERSPPNSLPR